MKFIKLCISISLIVSVILVLIVFIIDAKQQNKYFQYISSLNKKMNILYSNISKNKDFIESKNLAIFLYTEVNSEIDIKDYLSKIKECNDIEELNKLLDELEYKVFEFVFIKQEEQGKRNKVYLAIKIIFIVYSILAIIILVVLNLKR
jgi:hypothetical protein